jgi:hypothetical protein
LTAAAQKEQFMAKSTRRARKPAPAPVAVKAKAPAPPPKPKPVLVGLRAIGQRDLVFAPGREVPNPLLGFDNKTVLIDSITLSDDGLEYIVSRGDGSEIHLPRSQMVAVYVLQEPPRPLTDAEITEAAKLTIQATQDSLSPQGRKQLEALNAKATKFAQTQAIQAQAQRLSLVPALAPAPPVEPANTKDRYVYRDDDGNIVPKEEIERPLDGSAPSDEFFEDANGAPLAEDAFRSQRKERLGEVADDEI